MINQEKPFSQSTQETSEQPLQEKAAAFQERFPVLDEEQLENPSLKETTLPPHQAEPVMALEEEKLQAVHGGVDPRHVITAGGAFIGCCVGTGLGLAFGLHSGLAKNPGALAATVAASASIGAGVGVKSGHHINNSLEQERGRRAQAASELTPRPQV